MILLSSALAHEHRAQITSTGIMAAFQKPVRQSSLLRTLQRLWSETASDPATAREPSGPTAAAPVPARILIVEDNATNQVLGRRMVEKLGHHPDVVANGREALEALFRSAYDLVLMDCHMPEMDGYEATIALRQREAMAQAHAGDRDDRERRLGRTRTLPRGGHGRLSRQAGEVRGPGGDDQTLAPRQALRCADLTAKVRRRLSLSELRDSRTPERRGALDGRPSASLAGKLGVHRERPERPYLNTWRGRR
jgi:CheY-like chemotaxis protein